MNKKLIIYELNELPKQVVEIYIKKYPKSNIALIKKNGIYIDTFTTDTGELHPWTTWPTFYRGIDNKKHKIQFINQKTDINEKYPPVWEILTKEKLNIGIFGTLQSYPPLINKNVKFFLPDTFSPDSKTYPNNLSSFQNFDLTISANNSGTSRNIRTKDIYNFLKCIVSTKFKFITYLKLISQILSELYSTKFKRRRSLLQPVLGFDVFYRFLNETKPDFCTFFSNHLAGMMHRYWLDLFPEEFQNPFRKPSEFNSNSIIKAMHIADNQIGELIKFCETNSYDLWIAGSMGQKSIFREERERLYVKDFEKLIKKIGLNIENYIKLPSMYPDINIECKSKKDLDYLLNKILRIKNNKNSEIFKIRYKPVNNIVNLCIKSQQKKIKILSQERLINLSEFGISIMPKEVGTGYHIPEGVLFAYGQKSKNLFKEYRKIDTKLACPIILEFFKLKTKKYMLKTHNKL